ncbi:hypothetical protein BDZ94DRAFT_1212870 [Collybia nuda]|uniref:Uncharacterized protein n=1 Tax=Collybia nuda TaxID=64659 RepID=A0A9P5YEL0_9AGAR|nr:hypothetical protein BDZ94DRAFT_1212870 [Collybia nuda]
MSIILDNLVPRSYQEEVFERAQKGNVIAAMNTGSGKTLISLLLIKWISAQAVSRGKVIIFLVPKVTLVEQQGNFIDRNTPLRVIKLHGALDIDLTDRLGWRKRFAEHDVFVMTAQIFLNMLTHSIWTVDKVSLMIFDECHHTRKNHPYNGIMREYFQIKETSLRPKIFGMTASPIWSPRDVVGSLLALEANMNAKVMSVRVHVDELKENSPKPVEIIKEYSFPPETYDYPSPTIWMALGIFDYALWDRLQIPWDNIGVRYYATLSNLGPYAASYFLYIEMQQHISRNLKEHNEAMRIMNYDIDMDLLPPSLPVLTPLPPDFFVVQDILLDFEPFFTDGSEHDYPPVPVPLHWCSPKVQVLVDILLAYHSSTFQGIVFVEQRQIAASLARILCAIPELKGIIKSMALVGQGVGNDGIVKATPGGQSNALNMFRERKINLLIATSVAEEGLDFPACDLVVRFDSLHHLVGYVQSRGRARNKASTFIIMMQKGDMSHLSRYQTLKEGEPEVNKAYQTRHVEDKEKEDIEVDEMDEDDQTSPADIAQRERYVVPSSGAVLTYDNAINLLSYLCSLIPRDSFTPQHRLKFTGDFEATLHLPRSIPLSPEQLTYLGPPRRSKKEARRAAAFMAVKRLHELDVFDEFLLPTTSARGKLDKDIDGHAVKNVSQVPNMMEVQVVDPWTVGPRLWLHNIYIDDRLVAGLVTGTMLPSVNVRSGASIVRTDDGKVMVFRSEEDELQKRERMRKFTNLGIWLRVTARPCVQPPSLFVVPLIAKWQPDYDAIDRLLMTPRGTQDWNKIGESDYDNLIVMNDNEFGRPRLLRRIRTDLTPMSIPPPGSVESLFPTYHEYFIHRWTRKRWTARVPLVGSLVETIILPRYFDGTYPLNPQGHDKPVMLTVPMGGLIPQGCLRWFPMNRGVSQAFEVLPALCHRVTDIYRVWRARLSLSLPPIDTDTFVEALTLPSTDAGYSNQRMETLGDAVLELCTTVYLFNKYPHRHEGQLSVLRQGAISNRFLLARAKEIDLERFITSETQSVHTWRYVEPAESESFAQRRALRCYPRRSLQDCMEATLGAAFLTGGIQMALHTGEALGLNFGGTTPWSLRYSRNPELSPASSFFSALEEKLGYTFHRSELLLEAVTHPSFTHESSGPSYQRLEFLGDALLDLVVCHYLYRKFPEATSHQLAWPKTRAICAPALATLGIKYLDLHKFMLINRFDLTKAIDRYTPLLQATTGEEIVKRGWRYDPPKAISDVFESVMGAVFVDSGFNYERAAAVVEHVMDDILQELSPSLPLDPISGLVEWLASSGCTKASFVKKVKLSGGIPSEGISVLVHDTTVAGPIVAISLTVAKFMASERALTILSDPEAEKSLARVCTCNISTDIKRSAAFEDGTLRLEEKDDYTGPTSEEIITESASDLEDVEEVVTMLTQVDLLT